MRKGKGNLKFQIAVQEAKAGFQPRIAWCKSVAKRKAGPEAPEDPAAALESLRLAKLQSKLHYYQKQACKMAKKGKGLLVGKLARKVKESSSAEALAQLAAAKALDHTKIGASLLRAVLVEDDSIWMRVKDIAPECEELPAVLPLKKERQVLLTEIQQFVSKLYETVEKPVPAQKKKKDPAVEEQKTYFMSSLNQDNSDVYSGSEEDDEHPLKKKKKNRAGQRARRQMWEEKYGDKAKHVKAEKKAKIKGTGPRLNPNRPKFSDDLYNAEPVKMKKGPSSLLPSSSEAGLHPSWAAKLQQRQMKPASGEAPARIVFDD